MEVDDPVILPVDVASDGEKAPSTSRGSKRPFYGKFFTFFILALIFHFILAAMQTGHHPQTHKSSSPFVCLFYVPSSYLITSFRCIALRHIVVPIIR